MSKTLEEYKKQHGIYENNKKPNESIYKNIYKQIRPFVIAVSTTFLEALLVYIIFKYCITEYSFTYMKTFLLMIGIRIILRSNHIK